MTNTPLAIHDSPELGPRVSNVQVWLTVAMLLMGAVVGWILHVDPPAEGAPDWWAVAWLTLSTLIFVVLPLVWVTYSLATRAMRWLMAGVLTIGLVRVVAELAASCDVRTAIDTGSAIVLVLATLLAGLWLDPRGRDRRALPALGVVATTLLLASWVDGRRCETLTPYVDPDPKLWMAVVAAGLLAGLSVWRSRTDIRRVPRVGRLGTRTVSIERFRAATDQAFAVYAEHYVNADRARFEANLADKQLVVVLEDEVTGELRGFSTVHLQARRDVSGRPCTIIFTGDTVIDRRSWGQGALQREWARMLARTKLRRPWRPLHWFLVCRDYRTYLMLAEHIRGTVPRYDAKRPSPALQTMLEFVATDRFGDRFDPATGIVHARTDAPQHRTRAPLPIVTDELAQADPNIAYFLDRNPGYQSGDGLACIGDLTGRTVLLIFLIMTFRAPVRARRALAGRPD